MDLRNTFNLEKEHEAGKKNETCLLKYCVCKGNVVLTKEMKYCTYKGYEHEEPPGAII